MYHWKRPEEPGKLRERREKSTAAYVARCSSGGRTPSCCWPKLPDAAGEQTSLRFWMAESTRWHCAYCDNLLGRRPTIDHFLPKCEEPNLVYEWTNLYPCCDGCQEVKRDQHVPSALRPDEEGYDFDYYFRYGRDGKISINVDKTTNPEAWDRAWTTIRLFNLDSPLLARLRALALLSYMRQPQRWPAKPLDSKSASGYAKIRGQQVPYEHLAFRALYPRD